jgi:hypothetical protein
MSTAHEWVDEGDGRVWCWDCLINRDDPETSQPCSAKVCASEECSEPIDGGEGFDGYCGNCADWLEAASYWGHHD